MDELGFAREVRLTQTTPSDRDGLLDTAQGQTIALDTLLATKLYLPPPRRDLVRRPRLIARLEAGLRGPLTLVVAPAGFGKTTLLGEWRTARHDPQWPIAWLSLDAGDDDLARFLRYLIAALHTLHNGIGLSVLASLRSPQ